MTVEIGSLEEYTVDGYIQAKFLVDDEMISNRVSIFGAIFKNKKMATAEQIATFQRADILRLKA